MIRNKCIGKGLCFAQQIIKELCSFFVKIKLPNYELNNRFNYGFELIEKSTEGLMVEFNAIKDNYDGPVELTEEEEFQIKLRLMKDM